MNLHFIIVPLISALIAQIIKLIIDGVNGQFTWKDLNSYGGMPSSHAALVTSLFAMIGYFSGWNTPATAVALVFAIIVIRDAVGFRRVIGKHAKEINQLVHGLEPTENYKYNHLKERIGHTPLQIFFGVLTGTIVTILYILIF